jgi:diguanylate cyclase (GGDEF)-like protein
MYKLKELRPESMPVIGGVLACLFWFTDSAIDTYIFNTKYLYLESLLGPENVEIYARCQVVILLMAFSLVVMFMLRRHHRIRKQLHRYKCELERIVEDRTNDLFIKNTLLKEEIRARQKIEKELVHLATIDPLTLISNRRKFDDVLHYELNRDARYKNELSLIFCDLDYFKLINDGHGHKIGDDVLKEFTSLVSSNIRKADVFARWGGEEFVLLLPETNIETALHTAAKLRIATEKHEFCHVGKLTASFGVTQFIAGDDETTFIKRADDALYTAKTNGRNRVEALPPSRSLLALVAGLEVINSQ